MPLRLTLLLMIALIPLGILSCTDHSSSEKAKALQAEIEQLTKLNNEAQQAARRLESQIEASRQEKEKLKNEKEKLEADRDAASKELEQLKKSFERYKSQYKLSMQKRAPGMHIADFSVNGVTYKNVILKELNESIISFSYDAGIRKLSVNLLPDDVQDLLGTNITEYQEISMKPAVITDPRSINASRLMDYEIAVSKVRSDVSDLRNQIEAAYRKLTEAQERISAAAAKHEPVGVLNKFVQDQNAHIAKLESQLTQMNLREYEVTQERPKMQALK